MSLGEFFTSCDSVLLLHLCGQILSQTFMKNLTKCLSINVHLILHILWGHLMASGRIHTNFCNYFQIYNSWVHPLLRSPSRPSCLTLNRLNRLKKNAQDRLHFHILFHECQVVSVAVFQIWNKPWWLLAGPRLQRKIQLTHGVITDDWGNTLFINPL
jgi:hypothetical protein